MVNENTKSIDIINATKRQINKWLRSKDDSHLWPICGKFNATERAINRIRKFEKESGYDLQGLEYFLTVEREISNIVNSEI